MSALRKQREAWSEREDKILVQQFKEDPDNAVDNVSKITGRSIAAVCNRAVKYALMERKGSSVAYFKG